jgi:O-acetyl-ADP-ribose deacetylase (regulator of RNase III)
LPVTIIHGDIFASHAQTLVNPVNCRGVMGKGLALRFAQRNPGMLSAYKDLCASGELRPGRLQLYTAELPWVLNFPTKDHWRSSSQLAYIERGLELLVINYAAWGIESIAFPQLGTGKGGLDWDDVEPIMRRYLDPLPNNVEIYINSHVPGSSVR